MGSITGNQNPKVGEKTQFSINALTTIFSFGAEYEWYIFKKQKNNTWKNITNPIKKGSAVNYTFGEICLGIEIKIEVYETKQAGLLQSQASKRKISELIIIPRSNKTPEITKVILFNRGSKDVNKASYQDTLIAQAHCIGLFNQEIEFILWEDDAKGNGHNAEVNKNNRIPRIYKAKVNANGIAEAKISLAADERILKEIANKYLMQGDSSEGANHEYYVTATYLGKGLKASQVNVEVKNPDANAPRPNSPTFPATPDSTGPRQNDPQARIVNAYFVNSNNQKINKAKVGDKIFVQILSKEMVGKHIQYIIWEFDTGNHDEIYRSPKLKIISDTITHTAGFTITQDKYNKAIDLPIGDPDADNQNYFIEVLALDVNAYSKRFGVTSEGLMKVESGKSPAAVEAQPKPEAPSGGKCPRCEKLTMDEIDKIFTSATAANKKALFDAFHEGNLKFEINTCLRKAHFFAQVLAEVGTSLQLSEPEKFNYSVRRLQGGDYVRGTNWVKGNTSTKVGGYYAKGDKKDWKTSPFSYFTKNPKEAELYGRKDLNSYNDKGIQSTNTKAIANIVYDDKNRGEKYKLGNVNSGDGFKFMGKGIIQITGRTNYTEVNKRLERKGFNFDIVNTPDNVLKHRESVLSAMAFWFWKDLQLKSKGGVEVIDGITKIVNEGTDTYEKRKENFKNLYKTFQVDKCTPIENTPASPSSNWRFPIDNPMLCLYSQKGGEKPWHGSFGEKIRDGSGNHAGTDLLAIPGTPVYACLKGKIERIYTSTSLAGNVLVLKVTDLETFKNLKRNYTPKYSNKGELLEKNFNHNGEIYFVFMHLSKYGKFKQGEEVKYNDIIGYSGVSGNNGKNFTTRNPHLHFEITNVGSAAGLNGKCNAMVYFKFKTESDLSETEKQKQLEIKNKEWK